MWASTYLPISVSIFLHLRYHSRDVCPSKCFLLAGGLLLSFRASCSSFFVLVSNHSRNIFDSFLDFFGVCLYSFICYFWLCRRYHFGSHVVGENRFLCLAPHPVAHSGSAHNMQMYLLIFWPLTMHFQYLCVASEPCNCL